MLHISRGMSLASRIRPLSPQCPERGTSPQWHHGQARMHQPQQLRDRGPKPTITMSPPRPLLPSCPRTWILTLRSLLAGLGTPGALSQDGPRCWGSLGGATRADLPRPAALGPGST